MADRLLTVRERRRGGGQSASGTQSRPRDYLRAGRRHAALLVAGDRTRPQSGSIVALPAERRQRALLDASTTAR